MLDRIPLTLRHYFEFGAASAVVGSALESPDAWDAVRSTRGPFAIAADASTMAEAAAAPEMVARARAIAAVAAELGARRLCSYGSGTGVLERALLDLGTGVELICTDFAPVTVARLQFLLPTAQVVEHDLRADVPIPGDLHLMHRIDSELDDRTWHRVFAAHDGPILLVATELLDVRGLVGELRRRLGGSAKRAGYVRTEAALARLWGRTHTHERRDVGTQPAFLLRPKPR